MGLDYRTILEMPDEEARMLVETFNDLNDPEATTTRKYKVRRK